MNSPKGHFYLMPEPEYAKGAYIPGLEITRFAPEFCGFWCKNG